VNLLKAGKMTEKQARRYLEKVRWPNGPVCPHCGNGKKVYTLRGKSTRPGVYTCATCRRQFTVTIGTVMEDTHLPLRTWLMAFSLMCSAKKGISALQLQRDLDIGSYKTAWRMLRQVRKAMSNIEHGKTFEVIVEVDETYIGGKPRKSNRKDDDRHNKRGRGTKKSPVVGVVDREKGKVYAKVSLPNKEGKRLSGNQLLAILKRGVYGIYHHVSVKYLQNYVNEFCFRFNNRDNGDMFDLVLRQALV